MARASLCTAKNCRAIVRVLTGEATQSVSVNCSAQSKAQQSAGQGRTGSKAWRLAQGLGKGCSSPGLLHRSLPGLLHGLFGFLLPLKAVWAVFLSFSSFPFKRGAPTTPQRGTGYPASRATQALPVGHCRPCDQNHGWFWLGRGDPTAEQPPAGDGVIRYGTECLARYERAVRWPSARRGCQTQSNRP